MTYDDPRLAVLYDIDNPDGPDHDFFRRFADDLGAKDIVDLGCGTGLLTVTLVKPGRTVIGIEPAPAMLERAVTRPGGKAVNWVLGTSDVLSPCTADLIIMSGNVAMHIIGDDWHTTLAAVARALRPYGRLVFEARNPAARAWTRWNDPLAERDTPVGKLRESVSRVKFLAGFRARESWVCRGRRGVGAPRGAGSRTALRAGGRC
ncbi:class I SAM-dependent methyltransferase [Serinicoccus chungangensis]|uniref:class I SAM-dependent methyltransferase n=1 Tax=Serinicoccus chungangensis TaxID=767452 RepID=UPI0009F9078B|nr:class I SAM-dependent methyltransferase [Serinicoccus chungangensis]